MSVPVYRGTSDRIGTGPGTRSRLANDSDQFIASLTKKLEALHESKLIIDELNALRFEFCPACFAPVEGTGVEGACSLCKQASDESQVKERALRLINEYARQRQSSLDLQVGRQRKISDLKARLTKTTELWQQAGRHYTVSLRSPTTELRTKLRSLNREAGYAQRELEELATRKSVVAELREAQLRREPPRVCRRPISPCYATISSVFRFA